VVAQGQNFHRPVSRLLAVISEGALRAGFLFKKSYCQALIGGGIFIYLLGHLALAKKVNINYSFSRDSF
jgi:hypothetical protein